MAKIVPFGDLERLIDGAYIIARAVCLWRATNSMLGSAWEVDFILLDAHILYFGEELMQKHRGKNLNEMSSIFLHLEMLLIGTLFCLLCCCCCCCCLHFTCYDININIIFHIFETFAGLHYKSMCS
jgi:hypothetical protein